MPAEFINQPHAQILSVDSKNKELGFLGFVKYGSAVTEQYRGVSHLAEHLMCTAWDDMAKYFVQRGIAHNAMTSDYMVVYYFKGLDRYVSKVLDDVLLREGDRNIFNWVPSRESFERERKVVIQEYEGYMSKAYNALNINISRKYFDYDSPIGKDSVLRDITYEQFIEFFEEQRNFDLFAYSGNEQHNLSGLVETVSKQQNPAKFIHNIGGDAPRIALDPNFVPQYFGSSKQEVLIGDWFNVVAEPWEARVLSELWNDGGPDAPLMKKIRYELGLAYSAYLVTMNPVVPGMMSYVTVNPANKDKARDVLHETLLDWKNQITRERFDDVIAGYKATVEIIEAENYSDDFMLRLIKAEDDVVSSSKLASLTYDRIAEICEASFTKDEINIAEAGESLIL